MFEDINKSSPWESVEEIRKGWSSDRKYKITTADGEALLLRVAPIEQFEAKKKEYEVIAKFAKLGFSMSLPIDFGVFGEGKNTYMLLTWLEGEDLEDVLPKLPAERQYQLGREAGHILKQIHGIELAPEDLPGGTKKAKKLVQLSRYEESGVRIDGDETAIEFVKRNIDQIWKEKPVYQHGDFHPGNLIYLPDGSLGVIDFNRWEVGDPYEEFYKLESFGRELSIPYCVGQIDAYFEGGVPDAFWPALAVYVAHASLYSIKWAEKFGKEDVDAMLVRCRTAFEDYDGFRQCIPVWYRNFLRMGS